MPGSALGPGDRDTAMNKKKKIPALVEWMDILVGEIKGKGNYKVSFIINASQNVRGCCVLQRESRRMGAGREVLHF